MSFIAQDQRAKRFGTLAIRLSGSLRCGSCSSGRRVGKRDEMGLLNRYREHFRRRYALPAATDSVWRWRMRLPIRTRDHNFSLERLGKLSRSIPSSTASS